MPYMTSNPAYANAFNNIASAMLGSSQSDADAARSALLNAQREKTAIEVDKVRQEMAQRQRLADLASGYSGRVAQVQGPLPQGQTADQAFGQQVYDQMAPDIVSAMIGAGYDDPRMATAFSMLPGLSADQRSRNYMGAGHPIQKDEYFSLADSAAQQGTGKIPKMGAAETQLLLGGLAKSFGYDDGSAFLADLNSDPALAAGFSQAAEQGWDKSGGNLMAAMGYAQQFLNSVPQPEDNSWFSDPRRFEGARAPMPAAPAAVTPPAPGASVDPVEQELRRRGLIK